MKVEIKFPCGYEIKVETIIQDFYFDETRCPLHGKRCSHKSSSAQHNNKVDKKEVCEGNKQRKTTLSRKVSK